jgi:hypothetical protein
MSITKTITVKLPPLPEGYELCESPKDLTGVMVYWPSIGWVKHEQVSLGILYSDLAIFARPIAPKMRRMTMAELTELVPAGLYFRFTEETIDWYLVTSRTSILNILGAKDSVISTDGMRTWRKPEVEETE